MRPFFSSVFAVLIAHFCFTQNTVSAERKLVHKRIGLAYTTYSAEVLRHIGIDLTCGANFQNDSLFVELDEFTIAELSAHQVNYCVLVADVEAYYRTRASQALPTARLALSEMKKEQPEEEGNALENIGQYDRCSEIDWNVPTNFHLNPNNSPNSFGGCLTYTQVLQELDEMRVLYPNLISLKLDASPINQTTIEGRPIYYVRISDNPDFDEPDEPEVLYQSLIHSREAGSVMQLLYFMWYVLENYDSDDAIKSLVNNQALYFVPVFNPDGFVYNELQSPDGGGMQRKNRNVQAACSVFTEGVDLNRNSAYYWGNGGSSATLCSQIYMGNGPFSENETQIMRDFFLLHDFKLALNHHSYKNAMLHGYAGTIITNPRPDEYAKYSHDMSFYNRYAYGPSTSISALNSGNMNDWMLGGPAATSANGTPTGIGSGKNTLAWTPENGNFDEGGFWPNPTNYVSIAKRAMRMNLLAGYYSGKYAKLHDLNAFTIHQISDTLHFAIENLGQTSSSFTVSVQPISSNIVSMSSAITEFGMSVLDQRVVVFSYTLNPGIAQNDTIEFNVILTNDYGSDSMLYQTNLKKVYQPDYIFSDEPDLSGITNWTASGGTWDMTSDAFSGTTAITSNALPPYLNQESKFLQLNNPIDLSFHDEAIIQYYAKWDLERSFDYVQLQASTDGISWIPLCGRYTKPGSSANNTYSGKVNNIFQPESEPLYDGDTRGNWYLESIQIDAENNAFLQGASSAYFRFFFASDIDNSQDAYYNANFEGFSFHDFTVVNGEEVISNVGLKTAFSDDFKVYPNPVSDQLVIELDSGVKQIEVYELSGKLIQKIQTANENKVVINTGTWHNGLYIVVINQAVIYKLAKF